ncbi:mtDNA inheritance, partitioning of the mitochondrial organelle [Tilletia horrida]|uniref:MtDNA inheritance, partitioning of the mitochondrial organelle n=1 Tax=Tilletia horrida TaxID=155126 RepID=A0AAN6JL24_9BASI|nr:mtDNA inheritance, partitioning of the mitochondrial organelle [Tilletia horrida]
MQREQVFLTFGSFAAHVQTHFWNEQESYFDYGSSADGHDDDKAPAGLLDHDVAFRAGLGVRGQETFLPRALVFDLRDEFGTLSNVSKLYDALLGEDDGDNGGLDLDRIVDEGSLAAAWGNSVDVLQTRPAIAPSRYQHALDYDHDYDEGDVSDDASSELNDAADDQAGTRSDPAHDSKTASPTQPTRRGRKARRYWSDYARMPFHPRSLIRIGAGSANVWGSGAGGTDFLLRPMSGMTNEDSSTAQEQQDGALDSRQRFESYEQGHRIAQQLDKANVSDDNLRWFTEDADSLQAFNMTTTTSDAFSGFSAHFAEMVRDEYRKTDLLFWATEWGPTTPASDDESASAEGQRLARVCRMNQALSTTFLSECASLYVPIALPPPSAAASEQTSAPAPGIHVNPGADTINRMLHTAAQHKSRTWDTNLRKARWGDMWHAAALVAAHVETATLPSRLRDRPESIPQLTSRLNWRQNTRIANLGGCIPTPLLAQIQSEVVKEFDPIEAMLAARGYLATKKDKSPADRTQHWTPEFGRKEVEASWIDFTPVPPPPLQVAGNKKRTAAPAPARTKARARPYAQSITARDADAGARIPTTSVMEAWSGIPSPLGTTHFVPLAYNVPRTTHPQFFTDLTSAGRALPDPSPATTSKRVRTLPLASGLSTGSNTAALLHSHRRFVQEAIRGHLPLRAYGIGAAGAASGSGAASSEESEGVVGGRDGLKEVLERLEELLQAYDEDGAGADEEGEDEGRGTDEEWEEQGGEEWELDLDD